MRLDVNGVYYHVETEGAGDPLVLLHGFTGSMANWLPLLPLWRGQFRLVRVDLLGHGDSSCPPEAERYAIEPAAADLKAVLDSLGLSKVHLLGYSMGGRVALTFALQYPERLHSLILESSSPGIADPAERRERAAKDEVLAERIETAGLAAFVDYWESLPLFASQRGLSPEVRKRIRDQRLQNGPQGLAGSLRGMGAGAQPSWWERLTELRLPVLFIAGALDTKYCAVGQAVCSRLPQGRLEVMSGAGHTVHVEQPQIFGTIVDDFLRSVQGGRAHGSGMGSQTQV